MHRRAELMQDIQYYLSQVFTGFTWKCIVSGAATFFNTTLGGNWHLFELYFLMACLDLAIGVLRASVENKFSRWRLYKWVVKVVTHMLTIILVGAVNHAFITLTGISETFALNLFVFILFLTEASSVLDGAIKLGLPVPPLATTIIEKMRNRVMKQIDGIEGEQKPQRRIYSSKKNSDAED